jgi:DNA helicase HerA-like ATPase
VWQQDGLSNGDFAAILSDAGIPCTRADVENGARKPFVPKRVPPTPYVYNALSALSARFPDIQNELLIGLSDSQIDLIAAINRPCRFIDRI